MVGVKEPHVIFGESPTLRRSPSACRPPAARDEYMPRAAILLATLILAGCSQEEAIERLKRDLPVDSIEIVHARFPCRSPEMHFFGYRFRAWSKKEFALGDIVGIFGLGSGHGRFCRDMSR